MRYGSWVHVVQGKILSVTRWSDTHVGSSGGGGYVGPHGGVVKAPRITSNVVQRSQVFVLNQQGTEEALELGDLMPLREGQTITAVYGGLAPGSGRLLLLHNQQTNTAFAEPLRPGVSGPAMWFLAVLILVWAIAAGLVATLASLLPEVPRHASQFGQSQQPLDIIFVQRANQTFARCISMPHRSIPNCASYEKAPLANGATACSCKSVAELLDDRRDELREESLGTPAQQNFEVAAVMLAVVGGLAGFIVAGLVYKVQMRSQRHALRQFMNDAAEESSKIARLPVTVRDVGGNVMLAVKAT